MEETLWNGIRMAQPDGGFRLGTDSVLLAQFLTVPRGAKIADLGSGCGTLGLLLCASCADCAVTGVELDEAAHRLALENIEINGLQGRLSSVFGDVRAIRELLPVGGFSCVISNPPYFPVGSGKASKGSGAARSEETLTLRELCEAAAYLLPSGGRFALVHRPERLCDVFCAMREHGVEPKRVQFVRHTAVSPVCLVLIEGRRGGRPGLTYLPDFCEFTPDGAETEAYRAAYHRGEQP
ncbi:MAG: methyltransferase [Oscillospiraceae bacterium]|nr:methyltransferase [Oscillospiraceae bacterium]